MCLYDSTAAIPPSTTTLMVVAQRIARSPGRVTAHHPRHRQSRSQAGQRWPVRMMRLHPPIWHRCLRFSGCGTRPCGSWRGPGLPAPPALRLGAKGSYCVGFGARPDGSTPPLTSANNAKRWHISNHRNPTVCEPSTRIVLIRTLSGSTAVHNAPDIRFETTSVEVTIAHTAV